MIEYDEVWRDILPKKLKLEAAEKELKEKDIYLKEMRKQLREIEA